VNSDITLTAQWSANSYTITLDKNGGSAGAASVTATYGAVLPSFDPLTRTGYTLKGYYPTASSDVMVITAAGALVSGVSNYTDDNGKWIKTENCTLYAQWTANDYTITLDKNNGSADGSATATYDSSTLKSISHVSRTGYTLTGYWTAESGGTKVIDADGKLVANVSNYTDASGNWTKAANCALYAQWTAKTTTITLDKQGGNSNGGATATYDSSSLSVTHAAKDGFTLDGYYNNNDYDVKVINADGTLVANKDGYTDSNGKWKNASTAVTLYAKWNANSSFNVGTPVDITLDYTCNGTVEPSYDAKLVEAKVGVTTALALGTPATRPTKSLEGFYADASCTTKVANANGALIANKDGYTDSNGKWTRTEDTTLYAKWVAP